MKQLLIEDLRLVVSRLPKDIVALMKKDPVFVGGGFIRENVAGEKVNDIDLFGGNIDTLRRIAEDLRNSRTATGKVYTTDNAITVLTQNRMPVQFITRWLYTDAQKLAESFDFAMCQAVVWWDKDKLGWTSLINDRFYEDIASKRLTYTYPQRDEDAGGSILRVVKFLRRGWNISPENLAAVIAQLMSKVDTNKPLWQNGIKNKAMILTGLLREVDPLNVVDGIELIVEGDASREENLVEPVPAFQAIPDSITKVDDMVPPVSIFQPPTPPLASGGYIGTRSESEQDEAGDNT